MNESIKPRLWTKDFVFVCLVGLFCNTSIQMLNTTLAPFAYDMWASNTLGGLLTSFFNVGSIFMAFFCGALANKYGRKNSLAASALVFCLPTLLMAFFPTPAVCLAVRLTQGMAKGMLYVIAACIVVDVAPQSRTTEALGYYGLGSTMAFAVGPYIGLALADSSYSGMFTFCAGLFLLGGIAALFITYEKRSPSSVKAPAPAEAAGPGAKKYTGIWKLIEKKALPSGINYALCFASTACVLIFIAVFSQEVLGYSTGEITPFYLIAAAVMLVFRLFGGRLADKYGPMTMIIPGHLAILIMLGIMASPLITKSYALYLVCGALYGAINAAIMPAMNAMAVLFSPKSRNSEANASFAFVQDFGILIASLTFGSVIDSGATLALGYRKMFIISIVIALVSFTMSFVLYNRKACEKGIRTRED